MPEEHDDLRRTVREGYAKVARGSGSCCGQPSSCCGSASAETTSRAVGYSDVELASIPDGSDLGLGCGNPVALASLRPGETVLDLGSGAGIDCFLAAQKVEPTGRVIGVDMTPEMIEKARENARKGGYKNVEFRLGEIETLPVPDNHVDVIISNCVVNLSPEKDRVFRDAFRVLKPGGRLMVSDIVLLKELPDSVKNSVGAYIGCVAGASKKNDYLELIKAAGFKDVSVVDESSFASSTGVTDPIVESLINDFGMAKSDLKTLGRSIKSIKVQAIKPHK